MMQFTPRAIHRQALGTCLLFLLLLGICLSLDTGDESPITAILPSITLVSATGPRSPQLIVEPSRSEPQIRTWNDALVGILVPTAVIVLVLLARLIEFDRCQDSPTSAQLDRAAQLEHCPSEPPLDLSPLLEEKDDQCWEGPGNATCYPALLSVLQVNREPVNGYTLDFTEEHQAEEEVSLMDLSEPADVPPDVDTHHGPAVPSARYPSESSTTSPKDAIEGESLSFGHLFHNDDEDEEEYDEEELLAPIKNCSFKFPPAPLRTNEPRCGVPLEPASQVSGHPGDSVLVDEKAEELEDPLASDPQAREPIGTGIGDLTAQVSGTPIPDTGSTRACRLGFASSLTSKPRKPHHSDAALSAQVSGTASRTGFLGNLRVQFKAAAASAKRSRVIVQASLGRIKTAGKRGFKSRKAAVPEHPSDPDLSFTAPAPIAPLSAEDTEETKKKPKKVVRFSNVVQIREAPRSVFDELARKGPKSKKAERKIEKAYRTWIKGKWREEDSDSDDVSYFFIDDGDIDEGGFSKSDQEKAVAESRRSAASRWGGGLAFYGASTSRDGSRQFSEEEWEELEEFQSVRSGTTAAVVAQPEATPMDLDLVIYKILLELAEPPQPPPATANKGSFGTSAKRGWKRLRGVVSGFLC